MEEQVPQGNVEDDADSSDDDYVSSSDEVEEEKEEDDDDGEVSIVPLRRSACRARFHNPEVEIIDPIPP